MAGLAKVTWVPSHKEYETASHTRSRCCSSRRVCSRIPGSQIPWYAHFPTFASQKQSEPWCKREELALSGVIHKMQVLTPYGEPSRMGWSGLWKPSTNQIPVFLLEPPYRIETDEPQNHIKKAQDSQSDEDDSSLEYLKHNSCYPCRYFHSSWGRVH